MSGRTVGPIMPDSWAQAPDVRSHDISFQDLASACCEAHDAINAKPSDDRPCGILHNVLNSAECAALVQAVDAHHDVGAESLDPGARSQFVSHDEPLSRLLWSRVRRFFPDDLDGGKAQGLMENIALAKYYPGQVGFAHLDYRHADHLDETIVSRISFTLYLNQDYEGGELDFVTGIRMDGSHDGAHTTVNPTAGSAAIFYQGVPEFMHYPNEVRSGPKHILRADVLYKFQNKEDADVGCKHAGEWVRPLSSPIESSQ
jgi:hypothetical protein